MTLAERADIIPGRSLTRSKKVFGRWAASAEGATITDTDGRTYIDMLCGLGAISLGYAQPMPGASGGVYSLPHRVEVEAAEAVLRDVAPWAAWVRFTKTGSEATHAAYRVAKAATGRKSVIRFDDSYHGWHEWCDSHPAGNRIGDVRLSDAAAVFVEPHRFTGATHQWLVNLREWCDASGALLVFDSMIYGGRWALGGASEIFGVTPDLECYGKAFGNGQAVSFVVGTDGTKPHGEIPSGTFSGDTCGLFALLNTLAIYKAEPVIDTMWQRGRQLQDGLRRVVPSVVGEIDGAAPVCQRIRFVNEAHKQPFCEAMLDRGVIWHPDVTFTMYSHAEAQIDQVIEAVRQAVGVLT